jgi:hypothetical protein
LIAVAWLNLVTIVIAACRVAAHADAIELEIIAQASRAGGGYSETSWGESLESSSYYAHVVGRGHQSTLRRIS